MNGYQEIIAHIKIDAIVGNKEASGRLQSTSETFFSIKDNDSQNCRNTVNWDSTKEMSEVARGVTENTPNEVIKSLSVGK